MPTPPAERTGLRSHEPSRGRSWATRDVSSAGRPAARRAVVRKDGSRTRRKAAGGTPQGGRSRVIRATSDGRFSKPPAYSQGDGGRVEVAASQSAGPARGA